MTDSDPDFDSDDEGRAQAVWTKEKPHPYGVPCEEHDGEGGSGRFARDFGGNEPSRLSDFDWDSLYQESSLALLDLPEGKISIEAETMETSGSSVRANALKISTQFYAGRDMGSLPLVVDEGHEVISESSSELNSILASERTDKLSTLVVSATLTQEFVDYVTGKVIYIGDQSRCVRRRGTRRNDEHDCWDGLVEELTYGSLRKLSQPGMTMMIFQPTLPKIEHTASVLNQLVPKIEKDSTHEDFPFGRRVEVVINHGRMTIEDQVAAVKSDPSCFKIVVISGIGDSSVTPENCLIGSADPTSAA